MHGVGKIVAADVKVAVDAGQEALGHNETVAVAVNDDAAGIFVYNTKWYGPYASKVEGIRFSPVSNGQDLRWASLKR